MTTRITISLSPTEDADILNWLSQQENRSAYIRTAIRRDRDRQKRDGSPDLDAIRRLLREELAHVTIAPAAKSTSQEDPELGQRLDNMF